MTVNKGASRELTNLKCEKAKPGLKPYRIADAHGLHLLVMPAGSKLWRWKFTFEGKQKEMAFGKFPDVSLMEARKKHMEARALLATNVDPMALRKESKIKKKKSQLLQEQKESKLTFEMLAQKWFLWWSEDKSERFADRVERWIKMDILPSLGHRDPNKITRLDIIKVIQAVDNRGAHVTASRELQIVHQIYEHGIDNCLIKVNLASGLKPARVLKRVVGGHFTYLQIEEVPKLLCDIRDYDGHPVVRMAMELLSLTFVRTAELLGARWKEFDWDEKLWRLPEGRMKMKTAHLVPLSTQSIQLLTRLHRLTGENEYLFPGISKTNKESTLCHNTLLSMLKRMGYKRRMTGHGWRSIASTFLRERGFTRELVETQLAHLTGSKTERSYNHALYLQQRAAMMQVWADALDEMRDSVFSKIHLIA